MVNSDYMKSASCEIYMLNYTFHYIQNTGVNHISPLQENPSSMSLRSISGVVYVCVPTGCNLLQCYVQCVLMKQKGSSML